MGDLNGLKLNKEYPFLFYVKLLILFQIEFINPFILDNLRKLNIYNSEIHLIIKGSGTQNILNKTFQYEPFEVIVNGYINSSCKKTCYFTEEINNITIKFSNQINSCQQMFLELKNISEIDLSKFDASQVTSMNKMFQ